MVDIFDEVREDLRAERAQRLASKYGWIAVLAVVLVAAGAGGWEYNRHRQAEQDQAAASRYISIMNAINQAPALSKDARTAQIGPLKELAANAPEGYKTLARLRAAGLMADSGDVQGAAAMYYDIATDTHADQLLRDLALLLMSGWQLDTGDPNVLAPRLQPLAQPGNPWAPLAQEQLAMLDLRQGKIDDARTKLKGLAADVLAPAGVRARANALLQGLG
ncbi:MAG TPA: tetratricopeptide repeat protein [Rhodopila sp.]|uniref:tetratricopeptide repeat protein n=1 Tax=Rhodopila sp. TaxID=2480087 RepID=UPI002D107FA1|nr:tetratricopeptide repeat protein [Rhodopila sp.]HVY14294.1 tetratricopeptide repeat protein [Rhodopila sp.]